MEETIGQKGLGWRVRFDVICLVFLPYIKGISEKASRRMVLEALVIQQRRSVMNLNTGLILDPLWTDFVCPRSDSHMTASAVSGGPAPI